MALDLGKYIPQVVDLGATSYETRLHRQILFAGLVGLALIILWKVIK